MSLKSPSDVRRWGVALIFVLTPSIAFALVFRLGPDARALVDINLAYGLQYRVSDRDNAIIGRANGGKNSGMNFDDGNLNYKDGRLTSNMLRATAEVDLAWRDFGVFVRGYGFYDYENEEEDRDRTDLTEDAKELVGSDVELQDHYISARFEPAGRPLNLRLGNQVINWGEATFIQGGVNIVNPINLPLFQQPVGTLRDLARPVGMMWASATVSEFFNIETFYQYKWRKSILPPLGSYFSTTDVGSPGGTRAFIAAIASDQGTDLGPFGGFDPNFLATPRTDSEQPRDNGQWGITLRSIVPQWSDAKIGLHFAKYHSRLPVANFVTPNEAVFEANTAEATAAVARDLSEGFGIPLEGAQTVADLLAFDQYAKGSQIFVEYPEDIKMVGLSFSRTTVLTGTSIDGEIAHQWDVPMQIGFDPHSVAWLNGVEFLGYKDSQLGNPGPNETVKGWKRGEQTLVTLGFNQLFGPRFGASQTFLAGEVGWLHVWNMPNKSDLRLAAPAQNNDDVIRIGGSTRNYADQNSWGYRLAAGLTYPNVLGAVNLRPGISWSHDVEGNSPLPNGPGFLENRKSYTLRLGADYLNQTLQAAISYTSFFGAGRYNLLRDRDFINFNISFSF